MSQMDLRPHQRHYDNERFPHKVPFLLQRQVRLVHRYDHLNISLHYEVRYRHLLLMAAVYKVCRMCCLQ